MYWNEVPDASYSILKDLAIIERDRSIDYNLARPADILKELKRRCCLQRGSVRAEVARTPARKKPARTRRAPGPRARPRLHRDPRGPRRRPTCPWARRCSRPCCRTCTRLRCTRRRSSRLTKCRRVCCSTCTPCCSSTRCRRPPRRRPPLRRRR